MQDMINELRRHRVGYQGKDSMRDKAKRLFGSSMKMDMDMPRSRSEVSKEKPRMYAQGGEVSQAPEMKRGGHRKPSHSSAYGHEHHKMPKVRTPKLNIESASGMEHMGRRSKGKKHHYNDGGMVGMDPATYSPVMAKRGGKITKKRYNDGGMVNPEMQEDSVALKRGGKARKKHHYDFGGRVSELYNYAKDNAPRAMALARQYAPQAREAIQRYAPRIGERLQSAYDSIAPRAQQAYGRAQQAYGMAKRYAPQAQDFIGKFSPDMASRFGQFRSAVGLKKGGKAQCDNRKKHEEHYAMGGVGKIRRGQSTKNGMPAHRRGIKGR